MFTRLVASAGRGSPFRSPAVIAGSVGAHVALLAGVIWASAPDPSSEPAPAENEEVTYIDITEIPEPETVFEEPAEPEPEQAAAPVAVPNTRAATPRRTLPRQPAAPAEEPAGFQELRTPLPTLGVPPADPTVQAVRPEDFGGRGKVGGTASGTPAGASADTGRIGTGTQTSAASGSGGAPTGTFSSNMVDRAAALSNQATVVRQLQRLYPDALKESRTEGVVVVQFVVTAEGRVDMSTVQVVSATHGLFADATMKVLKEFRFRPARKGEHNVRMLTSIPIQWELNR